jgi:hypothetical protein
MRLLRPIALVLGCVVATTLSGCGGGGDGTGSGHGTPAALGTAAPGDHDLLCGIVPRRSAATALGRDPGDLVATGRLRKDRATRHVHGACTITPRGTGKPALSAEVVWPSAKQAALVESLIGRGTPYTFPDSYAPGVAFYNGPGTDVSSQAVARVVWGDYVVSVVDDRPASGRDALDDSVALVHQVIAALALAPAPRP